MRLDQKNTGSCETQDDYNAVLYLAPNGRDRIVEGSCRRQWIAQRRAKPESKKKSPWTGKHYCQTKEGLARVIRESFEQDSELQSLLKGLPDRFAVAR